MSAPLVSCGEGLPRSDEPSLQQSLNLAAFQLLPLEIRRAIWRATFPPPRIIDPFHSLRTQEPPIALWINQESRHEALRHYYPLKIGLSPYEYQNYVNFARDLFFTEVTIVLGYPIGFQIFGMDVLGDIKKHNPTILNGVTRLAAEIQYWDYEFNNYTQVVQRETTLLSYFPNLDTIILVGYREDTEGIANIVSEYKRHFDAYYEALLRENPNTKVPRTIYRSYPRDPKVWYFDDPQDVASI
ncbi:hypothetical protein BGZ60DRAFT_423354 [Tricladium varicosporioides]|nr:hypothetical protein BGZ60DRAFT_423354 [Hymenoscyphus varicosporioides]